MQDIKNSEVRISAPARLHFGFLDLHGGLGRLFGSLGVTLEDLRTSVVLKPAREMSVSGPGAKRAQRYAERVLSHLNIRSGVNIQIQEAIPEHSGLGSGTQMALAIGSGINSLFGTDLSVERIARLLDRGNRSGVGIATFKQGGFIVDGGRNAGTEVPPVISQIRFPDNWRFVLVLDREKQGVHGKQELQAFDQLAKMKESVSADICRLLVLKILPAIVEEDCEAFGSAISAVQRQMGEYFELAQSGIFASERVGKLITGFQEHGAHGIGQSSWGPTGFALFASETDAYQALKQLRPRLRGDASLEMILCRARNEGASIVYPENNMSSGQPVSQTF